MKVARSASGTSFVDAMQALTGRGPAPVYSRSAPTHMGDGREAMTRLLDEHPETDAVFCGADSIALGALIEARSRGIAVPDRLRVLGYGDLNFARHTDPPLSTLRIDGTRIGRLAASMLADHIEGRHGGPAVVVVGFELIERVSA